MWKVILFTITFLIGVFVGGLWVAVNLEDAAKSACATEIIGCEVATKSFLEEANVCNSRLQQCISILTEMTIKMKEKAQ